MAAKKSASKRSSSSTSRSKSSNSKSGNSRSRNGRVTSADAVRSAKAQIEELTGRPIDGVLGLERTDDGWIVMFELVELRRIPDSTDVLGVYAVALDEKGELREYRRTNRYYRSQVEEG
jgi:Gas vesicle synthesis protein GvpO